MPLPSPRLETADRFGTIVHTRSPCLASRNPDRDAQFEHINAAVIAAQAAGQPVISIDTKKKELIGPCKNVGSDYRPRGCPDQVKVHDFVDAEPGKVVPYGVYDIAANAGCVSVGIDNDTAQFSVNSVRRWLDVMGRERYPTADRWMITADGGGSNGSRVRLFKVELQKLADETGLTLQICHFPPGTSKWNKIEHRMFCHITQTWRGKPLTSRNPSPRPRPSTSASSPPSPAPTGHARSPNCVPAAASEPPPSSRASPP